MGLSAPSGSEAAGASPLTLASLGMASFRWSAELAEGSQKTRSFSSDSPRPVRLARAAPSDLRRGPESLPHAALKEKIPPGESLLYFAERSNTVTEIDWRRYGKMIGCREFSGPDGNPAFGPD